MTLRLSTYESSEGTCSLSKEDDHLCMKFYKKKKDLDEVIKRTNCTCKKYDVP